MKTLRYWYALAGQGGLHSGWLMGTFIRRITVQSLFCFSLVLTVSAQISISNTQAIVTIRATDAYATEPCTSAGPPDPGRFTVRRSLGTNTDLVVHLRISGTASNGIDYLRITNAVVIPKGAWSVDVPVVARPDQQVEGPETVVARVMPPVCVAITVWPPPPECYLVGQPSEAVVFIRDCAPTNRPPLVRISEPPDGKSFPARSNIQIVADTVDPDGYCWMTEFFAGPTKIGEQRMYFLVRPTNGTPISFEMTWSNVPPGRYALTARAHDDRQAIGVSDPVHIVVGNPPPYTNCPPVVSIVATDPLAIEGTNCWSWWNLTNCNPFSAANLITPCPVDPSRLVWWFTNCGPKSAILTVRRHGCTNADVVVHYTLRGTATNGLDYEFLPGTVTIPAGQRKADILIVPKEEPGPDRVKTVIARLVLPPLASPLPPPYQLGTPVCAGAVIVDSDRPLLASGPLPDRCFFLGADVLDGAWYRVEHSENLAIWTEVCTNQAVQGRIHFVDPEADQFGKRFYRAVPVPAPVD